MTKARKREGRTIEVEARTQAAPRQAWEAFADKQRLLDWWVDAVEGEAGVGAEMVCAWDALGMRTAVKTVEAVPGERLVLEWKEEAGLVVWEIDVACEGGETVVKVVCSGFGEGAAWDELYEGMKSGFPGLMKALRFYLDHHFGERRRVVSVMRQTPRPEATSRLLTEPELTRWMAREAQVGAPGQKARLVLRSGRTWTGSVNAAAAGVLDMSCDEVAGFLFLMCWQQRVWAVVQGWNLPESEARAIEVELGTALDALVALS
jgi:uncharacterized protein YndB with AHSA1/START domain